MAYPNQECFDPEAPVGEGHRFQHDCTNKVDKSLIITRTRDGWVWYCHRCKEFGIKNLDGISSAAKVAFIRSLDVKPTKAVAHVMLPSDYTSEITAQGLAYLYVRGIQDVDIKKWRIGYSPKYDRVIFPVYNNHKLVFFQGRTLSPVTRTNPKYMNVFQSNRREVYFVAKRLFCGDVVIVEDIVSAIRASYTLDVFAMLSTHVPEELVLALDKEYDNIYLWLDPDKRAKCIKMMRRYQAFGIKMRVILSDKDPKFYDDEEIRRLIYGG